MGWVERCILGDSFPPLPDQEMLEEWLWAVQLEWYKFAVCSCMLWRLPDSREKFPPDCRLRRRGLSHRSRKLLDLWFCKYLRVGGVPVVFGRYLPLGELQERQ